MYKPSDEILAEYILDNDTEKDDYKYHCSENKLKPFDLRNRRPMHILEHAAIVLNDCGYEMKGWYF